MTTESRAPLRYVLVTSGVTLGWTLWYVAWCTVGAGPAALAYLALPIGAAVAAWSVVAMLRTARLDPSARRFWKYLVFSFATLSVGYAVLAVEAFRDTSVLPSMPTGATIFVAAGFLAAMWAVGRVPLGVSGNGEHWKQWLDRMIAFLGCGAVLFNFGLAPMINAKDPWSTQAMVLIAMSFVLAVGGITKVSYIGGGPVDRVAIRLVASMGLVGAGVAVLSIAGGYDSAVPAQAVVLPLAPVMAAVATRRQWTSTGARPRRSNTWLPYLAVAAVDVPLAGVLFGPLTWTGRIVIVTAIVVTALVTVRQWVAFRENARLLREKRAYADRLQHEVTHDGLTGLGNRGLFRQRLAAALADDACTVLLVDLDDFKTVNDSLGHEVGDHLLIAVAESLRAAVGADGLPVRLAGDEFAVLLTEPRTLGETVAQRILDAFGGPISRHQLLVHASIGIATAVAGTSLDQLMRDADTAMYAAKQRGKANFVRFHDGMEQPALAHAQLGGELRRALDADEFILVYQPIVDLVRERIIGVEALVRWQHPTRGLVSPIEFIPAAEATGLIVPLGRYVLRETCRQTALWLAEFGPEVLQKAGPNVSVRQLHDPDFVNDVRNALADAGLAADRLVLEVTESAVLRGPQVLRTLHQLHDMGVRLALDDFGTGESSLSLLRAFPASIIKLDKSFVDGIELDEPGTPAAQARQAVAHAVIQLAGALGLDTVAEGIENAEQHERLRGLGYTLGQGYHFARPMSASDVTRLFAAQRATDRAAAQR
ncbi:putative bifunctional diguanylate cyclase/phosphodiesterase [Micromonosporaceae bacterium Da 78-11]